MADEAFFLTRWVQAFNNLSWIQLRANLRLATMPLRQAELLADALPAKLFITFKVPLVLQDAAGQMHDQYMVKESGDLHLYPGTFQKKLGYLQEMQYILVMQEEWAKWKILTDDLNEA